MILTKPRTEGLCVFCCYESAANVPEGDAQGALMTKFMHWLLHQVSLDFNRKELVLLLDMKGWQSRSGLLLTYYSIFARESRRQAVQSYFHC